MEFETIEELYAKLIELLSGKSRSLNCILLSITFFVLPNHSYDSPIHASIRNRAVIKLANVFGDIIMCKKYMGFIDDGKCRSDRYGWIDDIENIELYAALNSLSEERMDLLTAVVFEGKNMTEIAMEKGLSVSAITQRMGTIKNI